jgi:protease-4
MADYAASGGYYIAMGCDTIVAQPHTITGSIGVFGVLFDASGLLSNKIGITSDQVKTGDYGELITISRPLTDAEKNIWQTRTNEVYETFTNKASQDRNVSLDDIKKVASGRVWTGSQAMERGLVDILGGFDDAVRIAAEKANVAEDFKVKFYPQQRSFLDQLLNTFEENASTNSIKEELGEYHVFYQQWQRMKTYQGVQARMPFELSIH